MACSPLSTRFCSCDKLTIIRIALRWIDQWNSINRNSWSGLKKRSREQKCLVGQRLMAIRAPQKCKIDLFFIHLLFSFFYFFNILNFIFIHSFFWLFFKRKIFKSIESRVGLGNMLILGKLRSKIVFEFFFYPICCKYQTVMSVYHLIHHFRRSTITIWQPHSASNSRYIIRYLAIWYENPSFDI